MTREKETRQEKKKHDERKEERSVRVGVGFGKAKEQGEPDGRRGVGRPGNSRAT